MTLLLLLACASGSDDSAAAADPLGGTAALAPVSAGACPANLAEGGRVTLTSDGLARTVRVILPTGGAPAGAPAVFAWHPLGVSATQLIQYLGLRDWAEAHQAVVVLPEARAENPFEWDFWNAGTHDLVLYDDLRTCLVQELGVDPTRISATGMSAGGLMTTYLGIQRGNTLATILPMSGGTEPVVAYTPPTGPFPAMLMYGGPTDTWGAAGVEIDFQTATLAFAGALDADDHFVTVCDHGRGHTIPPEGPEALTTWLLAHRYGEPSPFADGALDGLPGYCAAYAPPAPTE
ncbi:MAG: hypothetical protein RLZZ299_184 [Pseudomonadota bacterium]|jgi:poly(3-hydroxybutyrate) depolymerase